MQAWIGLKTFVATSVGLDRDALLLVASIVAILLAALIVRRPLSSPRPWLVVLALCLADEIATAAMTGRMGAETIELAWRDIALVMAVPTILLVVTRYLPALTAPEARPLRIRLPMSAKKQAPLSRILDASFTEIDGGASMPPVTTTPPIRPARTAKQTRPQAIQR